MNYPCLQEDLPLSEKLVIIFMAALSHIIMGVFSPYPINAFGSLLLKYNELPVYRIRKISTMSIYVWGSCFCIQEIWNSFSPPITLSKHNSSALAKFSRAHIPGRLLKLSTTIHMQMRHSIPLSTSTSLKHLLQTHSNANREE